MFFFYALMTAILPSTIGQHIHFNGYRKLNRLIFLDSE